MKVIYMAARYDRREEIVGYANELRNNGYEVNSRWLLGTHQIHKNAEKVDAIQQPENGITLEARPFAQDDIQDIFRCDTLIFFSEPPEAYTKRGGRHVEFGMAFAWHKDIIIIGKRENVFHTLPEIKRYDTWERFKDVYI